MNVDELGALMRSWDADAPPTMPTADRIVAIRRDVTRARVRLAVGVTAALAVILALSAPQLIHRRTGEPARPAPDSTVLPVSTEKKDGLPVYAYGEKLGVTATGPLNGTVSLTFTVPAGAFEVDMTCPSGIGNVQLAITVNGFDDSDDPRNLYLCGHVKSFIGGDDALGMTVGRPSTITVHIVRAVAPEVSGPDVLDTGIPLTSDPYTVGLRVAVPFDDYRFPPPPSPPPSNWRSFFPLSGVPQARGGASSPGHPRTYPVVAWDCADTDPICGLEVDARAETPGEIVVSIDGTEVGTVPIWDYGSDRPPSPIVVNARQLAAHGLHLHQGQLVTLTFDSRRMAGPWEVEFFFLPFGTG